MKLTEFTLTVILFSSLQTGFAQENSIPRDTSFTIQKTYIKEKKKFPNIEIAQVHDSSIVISKDVIYKKIGNRKLSVDIFEPSAHKNGISFLLIHGGGWRSGDKTHLQTLSKALANKGYTSFALEYRLSLEAAYPAGIEDIKDSMLWIQQNASKYQIDPQKIIILGTSSGGQMAALIGSINQANIFSVVDIDGILAFHHPDSEEGTMAAQWLNGTYEENPTNWEEASALTHISEKSAPTLFINSSLKRFSAGQHEMISKYKAFKIPYDVLTFDNSPHTFWYFEPWFTPMVNKIDDFVQKLTKGN